MEKKIIIAINPFTLAQKAYVVEDKGNINTFEIGTNEISTKLCSLAKQYNINKIQLQGNAEYLLKYKNDIINNKFDNQILEVEII